jgi:hypothetical protein
MPTKKSNNIVLVVCPLNSIIEDQLNILNSRGIAANVLVGRSQGAITEELFPPTGPTQGQINQCVNEEANFHIPSDILIRFVYSNKTLCSHRLNYVNIYNN